MRRSAYLLPPFLAACSPIGGTEGPTDRYQFVGGSKASIDFVFDRATGCIAEIRRSPSLDEFMGGEPVFDPSKPFSVENARDGDGSKSTGSDSEDIPDWAKDTPAEKAAKAKLPLPAKPKASKEERASGSLEFHGSLDSFEPWRCPSAVRSEGVVAKK